MLIVPARWQEVLLSLRAGGFPEAVIAGGALRDLDNNRPVKDVDIFVRHRDGAVELLDKAFGYGGYILGDDERVYANNTHGVVRVVNFPATKPGEATPVDVFAADAFNWLDAEEPEPPFQVITLDAAEDEDFTDFVLARMDIGLCR